MFLGSLPEPHRSAIDAAARHFAKHHDFYLLDHLEAILIVGAHAYGTETDQSDYDYLAVVTPRMRHLIGFGNFTNWEPGITEGIDFKVLSTERFVKLAAQGNPNVIETLFFTPTMYLYKSAGFQELIDHRAAFLSREVYKRFSGYAAGQFKKMESGKYTNDMGAKRKEWVDKIGYDPKDASHLIRLLYNGGELVRLGRLTPLLPDAQRRTVREIKMGQWSLDRVKEYANLLAETNEAWFQEACAPALRDEPDIPLIEGILMEIQRDAII